MRSVEIIKNPLVTEKAISAMEEENKLLFIVDLEANKNQIAEAFEELYEVEVDKVNTLIDSEGRKKAYIKLTPDYSADELATDIGIF